ncbi:MAG TPA: hypothetical protein VM165_13515 [Planctomycetaceae bacterium]|nr:hypothetical protein [Planctomycetaceae bacterium]
MRRLQRSDNAFVGTSGMDSSQLAPFDFGRVVEAVQRVDECRDHAVELMESAHIPYAVIGGHAVAAWIDSVDSSAARFTRNVDLLIHRGDVGRACDAISVFGYPATIRKRQVLFRKSDKPWHAATIRLLVGGEQVQPTDIQPLPTPEQSVVLNGFRCLALRPLVEMKLNDWRTIDKVHIQDLAGVDLVNADWYEFLPKLWTQRLESLLENPNG